MVYKIRVILDTKEDVIRDIAINASASLEDLHNAISNAFGFAGDQMASFYLSDENWEQGEEFPLFDMSEGSTAKIQMSDMDLNKVLSQANDKLIYVYDFLNMWTFFVELIEKDDDFQEIDLPGLLFSFGMTPTNAPEIQFEAEPTDNEDKDDDFFEELDDEFGDFSYN